MRPTAATSSFESAVLEHLDAAHNLARWLMRTPQDAEDVVQESVMRALKAFDTFRGGDFRPWLLTIVRNTSFTRLRDSAKVRGQSFDEFVDNGIEPAAECAGSDPAVIAMRAGDVELVRRAIDSLPPVLREVVVLREMDGMSYKEIGKIAGVPIGTVMSRLARGRAQLQIALSDAGDRLVHRGES